MLYFTLASCLFIEKMGSSFEVNWDGETGIYHDSAPLSNILLLILLNSSE